MLREKYKKPEACLQARRDMRSCSAGKECVYIQEGSVQEMCTCTLFWIIDRLFPSFPSSQCCALQATASTTAEAAPAAQSVQNDGLIFGLGSEDAWDEAVVGSPVVGPYCTSMRSLDSWICLGQDTMFPSDCPFLQPFSVIMYT